MGIEDGEYLKERAAPTEVKKPNVIFQITTTDDAAKLVKLEQQISQARLYGAPLNLDAAQEEIKKNKLYFIKLGDQVVGTAAYRINPEGTAYISNVAINPLYRGKGIGRTAMAYILQEIKDIKRIELVTHPENVIALKLYTSLGFEVEGRRENYFGDGEPRLMLTKIQT